MTVSVHAAGQKCDSATLDAQEIIGQSVSIPSDIGRVRVKTMIDSVSIDQKEVWVSGIRATKILPLSTISYMAVRFKDNIYMLTLYCEDGAQRAYKCKEIDNDGEQSFSVINVPYPSRQLAESAKSSVGSLIDACVR